MEDGWYSWNMKVVGFARGKVSDDIVASFPRDIFRSVSYINLSFIFWILYIQVLHFWWLGTFINITSGSSVWSGQMGLSPGI